MQTSFEGIWVPVVTPFRDEAIDHPALARLARHLAARGIAGLVAGATTGEGALLVGGELEAVFSTLREAVPKLPSVCLTLRHRPRSFTRAVSQGFVPRACW